MRSIFLKLAVLLASSSLTSAQTWTSCNPLDKTCPDDPALAGTYDFVYGDAATDFTTTAGSDVIIYGGDDGAIFRVEKKLDAPTIVSVFYIMWGKVEVTLKAAPGGGVVSSVVLQSDDLDEIDWEWIGSEPEQAQSNYFGKGNTSSYDRGAVHPVASQSDFHKYGLEWTETKLEWLIDDVVVRTLTPADVDGDFYPQTPMQLRIGSWAAGDPDNEEGTIEWSGGPINYTAGPYDFIVQEIKVIDYSNGTAYRYGDMSGSWESIEAINGTVGAGPQTGKGNQGHFTTTSAASASATGVLLSTNSASSSTSEPTSGIWISKVTDPTESTHSHTSSPSPSASGSVVTFESSGIKTNPLGGFILLATGLVGGWLLILGAT